MPADSSGAGTDVWARTIVGWHVAFGVMIFLGAVAMLVSTQVERPGRITGLALLLLLALAYWATAVRRRDRTIAGAHEGYLVVAVLVTASLCALDPAMALMLFVVYAQVWVFSRTLALGIAFTAALTLAAASGFFVSYGQEASLGSVLRGVGPGMAASMVFSVLLGVWIYRVIDQSRERANLIAQLQATRTELAGAHHAQGVMAERERMAREIHDTLAQGFTSIVMLAQAAEAEAPRDPTAAARRLAAIEDVARENLAEARALVAAFSPLDLDTTTLRDAVERLADRFTRETGLTVDVQAPEVAGLTRDQEVVLLRAAQEALTNIRRHAQARHVRIRLVVGQDDAQIDVVDDGVGFTPAQASQGFGLDGMRGRVAEVGGRVDVSSSPGAGTFVTVHVPRHGAADQARREQAQP
jgi:signal transduction histidine kinase